MAHGYNEVLVFWNEERQKWMVSLNQEVVSQHRLKQGSEKKGRKVGKKNKPSQLKVHNKNGGISYQQWYEE